MAILKAPFILVLNENRPVRNLLHTILKHAGYGVLAVGTENEAERLMRHEDSGIRLLVVDQDRCSVPGWPRQGRSPESVKLLYLTSFRSLPERVADALAHPETGFLAKPFSPKALLNLVEALIGQPEGARTNPSWPAEGSDWTFREAPAALRQQG
jgi:DNA-binding response OmpR family regulator